MGYTHYWRIGENVPVPADAFGKLARDTKLIIDAAGVSLLHDYDLPGTEPEISEGRIFFNGADDDGHETFVISVHDTGFHFCKTARKPYDVIVCALLIRAKVHYGDGIVIDSDGDWLDDEEWVPAAQLCEKLFGSAEKPGDF
jgi:hypothetical protein